jgi:hypothetical protein
MLKCDKCGDPQYRVRMIVDVYDAEKYGLEKGQQIGTDCQCRRDVAPRNSVESPYKGLVLEHVVPGQKIEVNSLRDVTRMEQEHNVVHAVTSYGENYIPPDQKTHTFDNGLYRSMRERGIQRRYRG